ncbi:helicase superfamily 1/2 ATP-binding domain protein [Vibrio phage 1.083.O._10N.286.52.B9]|nr:helicase superfamily 1/2 ATP-binding domain protein [Vibrio phage 1.083.O._10N.286.52.B9]
MITLRQHQVESIEQANYAYAKGAKTVCLVLPTGAGKTIVKAAMAKACRDNGDGVVVIFAHRDVLLGQISGALCVMGVYHSFITSKSTMKLVTNANVKQFNGNSFYDEHSKVIVASVDTFFRRDISQLAPLVTMWMLDETHHLTIGSKWHKCVELLPSALGLGVTATPIRGDKKGLGRGVVTSYDEDGLPAKMTNDGVFDEMVNVTSMGELIERGMLSPYRVFTPPSLLDLNGVNTTSGGDFNQKKLAKQTDKSNITGDVIKHYNNIASGKRAICFSVNIEHGNHVAAQFRSAGINAVNLSSKDSPELRDREIERFKRGEIQILVNCDLFGEGFDVPAVEVVIMLRKTLSYSLFKQQFGRMLRILDGKEFGILIDHVGNVEYFMDKFQLANPHDDPEWTLDRQPKAVLTKADPNPLRACPDCHAQYRPTTANKHQCPYCNHVETPAEELNALLAFQEKQGNLVEMNVDFISKLVKERAVVDETPEHMASRLKHAPMPNVAKNSAVKNQRARYNAQAELRPVMKEWLDAACFNESLNMKATQRAFELTFGIPVLKAQVLGAREALELKNKVLAHDGY